MSEPISAFQKAINAVESLSLQDQEAVLTLLQKRIADQRRQELTQSVAEVHLLKATSSSAQSTTSLQV